MRPVSRPSRTPGWRTRSEDDLLPYLANAVTHYFSTPMSIEELFLHAK